MSSLSNQIIQHQVIFMPGQWHESRPTMPVAVRTREIASLREIARFPHKVRRIIFQDAVQHIEDCPGMRTITRWVKPHNQESFEVFWNDDAPSRLRQEYRYTGREVAVHPDLEGRVRVYACLPEEMSMEESIAVYAERMSRWEIPVGEVHLVK